MGKGIIFIVVVLVIALIIGGMYIGTRNALVVKDQAIKASWSQVENVMQRRFDLIPNLVETVKGIAQQEQAVFGAIANARAAMAGAHTPADKIAANGQLDSALSRLLVVVENYPQLKSNENFMRLQDELAGTENRLAVERKRYNDTIQDYNSTLLVFPNSIFAGWAGFKENTAYFKAAEGAKEAPKVQFNLNQPAQQPAPAKK